MEKNLPERKPHRLVNFNYSSEGAYFITICTHCRRKILSHIRVGAIHESPADERRELWKKYLFAFGKMGT